MTAAWDGESFRRKMAGAERNAVMYAEQHRHRLKRGQPNGDAATVDEYEGIALAAFRLSTDVETDTLRGTMTLLDEMEFTDPLMSGINDKAAFRRGYLTQIRETRDDLGQPKF